MLVLAAPARGEVGASWGGSLAGWISNLKQATACKALFNLGNLEFDVLPNGDKRNEDDDSLVMADPFASECDIINSQRDAVTRLKKRLGVGTGGV